VGGRAVGGALVAGAMVLAVSPAASAAVTTTAASAGVAPSSPSGPTAGDVPAPRRIDAQGRPVIVVAIVGDSFSSGEGASLGTFGRVEVPGSDAGPRSEINPAHQSTLAPALQVIDATQAANPDVRIETRFVAVSGAVRSDLTQPYRPGTAFEQPAQLDAVRDAVVVIMGIGSNDARFGEVVTTMLRSGDEKSLPAINSIVEPLRIDSLIEAKGFASEQKALNAGVLATMNQDGILLGSNYPKVLPDQMPAAGAPSAAPFSSSRISRAEADLANEMGRLIGLRQEQALIAARFDLDAGPGIGFIDRALSIAGHELTTEREGLNGLLLSNINGSYHLNDLGLSLDAQTQGPSIISAVRDQFARIGVEITTPPGWEPAHEPAPRTPDVVAPPAPATDLVGPPPPATDLVGPPPPATDLVGPPPPATDLMGPPAPPADAETPIFDQLVTDLGVAPAGPDDSTATAPVSGPGADELDASAADPGTSYGDSTADVTDPLGDTSSEPADTSGGVDTSGGGGFDSGGGGFDSGRFGGGGTFSVSSY
jgi:hypothetical protein